MQYVTHRSDHMPYLTLADHMPYLAPPHDHMLYLAPPPDHMPYLAPPPDHMPYLPSPSAVAPGQFHYLDHLVNPAIKMDTGYQQASTRLDQYRGWVGGDKGWLTVEQRRLPGRRRSPPHLITEATPIPY